MNPIFREGKEKSKEELLPIETDFPLFQELDKNMTKKLDRLKSEKKKAEALNKETEKLLNGTKPSEVSEKS